MRIAIVCAARGYLDVRVACRFYSIMSLAVFGATFVYVVTEVGEKQEGWCMSYNGEKFCTSQVCCLSFAFMFYWST